MHSSNIFKSLICNRSVTSLTSSFWMARILWRAASQFALFPVITIVSELLFSAGRSILVLLSSRICHKKKKKKSFQRCPTSEESTWRLHSTSPTNRKEQQAGFSSRQLSYWAPETGKLYHLLDVGTSFPYDVLVELLEDGDRNWKAVFNLREKGRENWTLRCHSKPHTRNLKNVNSVNRLRPKEVLYTRTARISKTKSCGE